MNPIKFIPRSLLIKKILIQYIKNSYSSNESREKKVLINL